MAVSKSDVGSRKTVDQATRVIGWHLRVNFPRAFDRYLAYCFLIRKDSRRPQARSSGASSGRPETHFGPGSVMVWILN